MRCAINATVCALYSTEFEIPVKPSLLASGTPPGQDVADAMTAAGFTNVSSKICILTLCAHAAYELVPQRFIMFAARMRIAAPSPTLCWLPACHGARCTAP
jgi:hypothetical protein